MTYRRIALYILIALAIVTPIRLFVAQPFLVAGRSMTPTFEPGDYLVIDELSYRIGTPQRGDIIVFRYPLDPAQVFIKRIVGLPGETVQVGRGRVTVVSPDKTAIAVLDEPYRGDDSGRDRLSTTTLHDDEYFVLGDDRDASTDSRVWGPLQSRLIIGRTVARLWPLSRASVMPGAHEFAPLR